MKTEPSLHFWDAGWDGFMQDAQHGAPALGTQMCSAPATLTLGVDAELEKDGVPCFQTHHWVGDEGQGLPGFGGTPLGSAPFLQQLIQGEIPCHRKRRNQNEP